MDNDSLNAHNEIVSRLSILDEADQKHVLDMVCQWFRFSANSKTPTQSRVSESDSPEKSVGLFSRESDLTPKEFLMEKKPFTNVERVVCLAYYLTHFRGARHFKTLDISKLNTEAAQSKFANPTVALNDTARSGLVVASTKGTKQISAMGEQFVLALPDRDAAKKKQREMGPRKRRKPTKAKPSKAERKQ
ncbi:hypothetical protein [Candidatus Spongiihabitans sp.]|uniref:hypothetical protein n=1 Tax=Candidatus Spongiihabitans sp. TaxID=3101308 RepID=UPI003C7A55DF